jgi:hypothetical protein
MPPIAFEIRYGAKRPALVGSCGEVASNLVEGLSITFPTLVLPPASFCLYTIFQDSIPSVLVSFVYGSTSVYPLTTFVSDACM